MKKIRGLFNRAQAQPVPRIYDHNGRTKLLCAIHEDRVQDGEDLLAAGADPNQRGEGGVELPLIKAIEGGHFYLFEKLLEHGACPDGKPDAQPKPVGSVTPVMTAVLRGRNDMLPLLIAAGANIDRAIDNGDTALHWAVIQDNRDAMAMLVEAGIDYTAKSNSGIKGHVPRDALTLAHEHQRPQAAALLEKLIAAREEWAARERDMQERAARLARKAGHIQKAMSMNTHAAAKVVRLKLPGQGRAPQ